MARRALAVLFTLLGLAFVLSIGAVAALYLLVGREPPVPDRATLTLRIGGDLAEVTPDDVVGYLRGARAPTLRGVVDNLRKAKVDERIEAVVIKPTGFTTPFWGKIQELRDAMLDFRASGKPLYAYLEYGGDRDYYLATAADKIFLMPSSPLELSGVATFELFLRGTLDKVGVYPDLLHIGDYKTAVNTFTEKGLTPKHREMDQALNRDLYDQIVAGIAAGRKQPEDAVRRLIDDGPFLPEDALRAGLIDDVVYEDQVAERLPGADADRQRRTIDSDDYARVSATSLGLDRGPRIAVIYVAGTIVGGQSGFDPLNGSVVGSDTVIQHIRQVRRDDSIRAVILRIDSPGGSANASDAIWRALTIARNEREGRPLIASMSDLAASGGYYVAMPAHGIVAQPSTLTGSIGIYGGKFVSGGVYQKLGSSIEATSIGKHAEMNSPVRPYNADERRKVQEQLQAFYDQFVEKAAQSRSRTPEQIDQIAQGRVWTGQQAKERGLVDALGGLDGAIAMAKERAGIAADRQVEVVIYPPKRTFYELLSEEFSGTAERAAVRSWLPATLSPAELAALRALRGYLGPFRRGEMLALLPLAYLR